MREARGKDDFARTRGVPVITQNRLSVGRCDCRYYFPSIAGGGRHPCIRAHGQVQKEVEYS